MYVGWIVPAPDTDARQDLEDLGVLVGDFNPRSGAYERCRVSDEAMERLDARWGQFIWALAPID